MSLPFAVLGGSWRATAAATFVLAALHAQAPPVFIEVEPAQWRGVVEQPLPGILRVGYDVQFFAEFGVPLLTQRLEVPCTLQAPWFVDSEQHTFRAQATPATDGERQGPPLRAAIGDAVLAMHAVGERSIGGRTFAVVELPFTWLPLAQDAGPTAGVTVSYASASKFTEDFLRGRQPVDRQVTQSTTAAPQWQVSALPEAGRPPGFHGAVGTFALQASTAVREVQVGVAFALQLTVTGLGNLERLGTPPLPDLPGFHVQGVIEGRPAGSRADRREYVFDVMPLRAGLTSVPPIAWATFDPNVGRYEKPHSAPVPLTVLPSADPAALPPRVSALVAADRERLRAQNALPLWVWLAAATGVLGLGALWWLQRHQRAWRSQRRAAHAALANAAAQGDAGALLVAFEASCAAAAQSATFTAAVCWSSLRQRARSAEVVVAAETCHAQLLDARYGGAAPFPAEVLRVAQALLSSVR